MSMTDPVADMLTRIRNACGSKHRRVDIPASKMKIELARILPCELRLELLERRLIRRIRRLVRDGVLATDVGEAFPLDRAADAVRAAAAPGKPGKVLLRAAAGG